MKFSRQEYWSELSLPSPGDFPDPGIELCSPVFQADSTDWAIRKPLLCKRTIKMSTPTSKKKINRKTSFLQSPECEKTWKPWPLKTNYTICTETYWRPMFTHLSIVWYKHLTYWESQFSRSAVSDSATPHFPVHHQLLELAQTHVHWVSDAIQHLILCHPHLLLPSVFPSIRVFSNESALHIRWPKYCSFSFSTSSSNEYSGQIFLKTDWFDLPAVQGTLKSLQHHNSKASVLQCSAFFMVQLSHSCMTTVKTIALTILIFFGKVMSLLFKTLSRFVMAILPRSNSLLNSWLQSPSPLILEPKKVKSDTVSTFFLFLYFLA